MQRPGLRPRSNIWPDSFYRQGWCGLGWTSHNVGVDFGNIYWNDHRLLVFYASDTPESVSVSPASPERGWKTLYLHPGGGWGWYAFYQSHVRKPSPLPDPYEDRFSWYPFTAGDPQPQVMACNAMIKIDPVTPTFDQGTTFGPAETTVNNTLTWGVPGYEGLPSGQYLLLHYNACWFEGYNSYFVTYPTNPGMTRHWNYRHDARSWGEPPVGEGEWTMIERGPSFNVDYTWIGGEHENLSFPAQTKAFGGDNIPDYVTTFSILMRGKSTIGGDIAASTLLGGPAPL